MAEVTGDVELGAGGRGWSDYKVISPSVDKVSPEERVEASDSTVLEWTNISYSIPSKAKDTPDKLVLNRINGKAMPGELLAIMGTSGAGKSTLLDVLAGRLVDAKGLKGHITVNGTLVNKKTFRKESGYVMQSDALFPLLTVRETFRYASYLRVPNKSRQEQRDIADALIKLLRLDSCADTIIGNDQIRGVSGGEKRRVSIGVDIVHQPKVIFLDEPTSGLDSSTAYAVIDSLRQLAHSKKSTIIMTIHQPSARIFELIDKVTFLAKGTVTYFGESRVLQSFIVNAYQELGLGNTGFANPPELFLDLSDRLLEENKIEYLTSKFESSKSQGMTTLPSSRGELENVPHEILYANSLLGDVIVLMHRGLTNILRTKELFVARFGSTIFFAVLGGTLFLHPRNDDSGIFHKASFFILTLAYFNWTSLEALPIFYQERETFEREYASGAYRAISYVLSTSLIYFPFLFAMSLVYNAIAYWLVDLPNTAERFLFQVFIVFAVLVSASTFATTLSVLLPDPMTAQTIGSAIFAVMLVFSGFFIKREDIPLYWIYFHYMSLFKYGIDSQLVNGLQGYASTPTETNEQVLKRYSVDGLSKWQGLGILIAWFLFYRSIFYYRLITAFNGSRKK